MQEAQGFLSRTRGMEEGFLGEAASRLRAEALSREREEGATFRRG